MIAHIYLSLKGLRRIWWDRQRVRFKKKNRKNSAKHDRCGCVSVKKVLLLCIDRSQWSLVQWPCAAAAVIPAALAKFLTAPWTCVLLPTSFSSLLHAFSANSGLISHKVQHTYSCGVWKVEAEMKRWSESSSQSYLDMSHIPLTRFFHCP